MTKAVETQDTLTRGDALTPVGSEIQEAGQALVPPATINKASSQWDLGTKRTVLVILLIVAVFILWVSTPALPLLIVSSMVAYLLNPIVDFCDRWGIPRGLSTVVLFVLLLIGLILLPVFLIPVLLEQLNKLGDFNVSVVATSVLRWLNETMAQLPAKLTFMGFDLPIGNNIQELQTNFQQYLVMPTVADLLAYMQQVIGTATSVVSSTAVIGISVVGSIVQVFFTIMVIFFLSLYLTKDAPAIRRYLQGLFPLSYQPEFAELLSEIGYIWQSFFRGQLILSFTIGVTTWLALQVAGMPGALILGILAGVLEIVPNLGPTLAMIPAVIVALIQGSDVLAVHGINNVSFALITVGIYFIIQQLENNLVVPRVIGDSVNLHPVVVICGVMVGFNVAGLLGIFLAAPLIASLRILGGYIHAKLLDYPPFQNSQLRRQQARRRFTYRRTVTGKELNSAGAANRTNTVEASVHAASPAVHASSATVEVYQR